MMASGAISNLILAAALPSAGEKLSKSTPGATTKTFSGQAS